MAHKILLILSIVFFSCNLQKRAYRKIEKLATKHDLLRYDKVIIDTIIQKPTFSAVSFPISVLTDTSQKEKIISSKIGKKKITVKVIEDQLIIEEETEADTSLEKKIFPPIVIEPPEEKLKPVSIPLWLILTIALIVLILFRRLR